MQPPVGFGRKCPKFLAYKVSSASIRSSAFHSKWFLSLFCASQSSMSPSVMRGEVRSQILLFQCFCKQNLLLLLKFQRLMRMNMPVSGDNTVLFRTTLFALVRTSMNMTPKDKGCFRDNNFRRIIRKLWPNTTQRMLDVILPEQSGLNLDELPGDVPMLFTIAYAKL